jgi:hypothetical protein
MTKMQDNKPGCTAAQDPAVARRIHVMGHWRGVGEPGR